MWGLLSGAGQWRVEPELAEHKGSQAAGSGVSDRQAEAPPGA